MSAVPVSGVRCGGAEVVAWWCRVVGERVWWLVSCVGVGCGEGVAYVSFVPG